MHCAPSHKVWIRKGSIHLDKSCSMVGLSAGGTLTKEMLSSSTPVPVLISTTTDGGSGKSSWKLKCQCSTICPFVNFNDFQYQNEKLLLKLLAIFKQISYQPQPWNPELSSAFPSSSAAAALLLSRYQDICRWSDLTLLWLWSLVSLDSGLELEVLGGFPPTETGWQSCMTPPSSTDTDTIVSLLC